MKRRPPGAGDFTPRPTDRKLLDAAVLAALVGGPLTAVGLAVKVGRAELQVRLSCARLIARKVVEMRGEEYATAGFWRAAAVEPRRAVAVERGAQASLFG